jgi:acyl carrier protein
MGLDIVELFMAVEDGFGIYIPDAEAQEATTVGKLHQLVFSKVSKENRDVCLTSVAFYRARKALMYVSGVPKQQIGPSTSLERLIPQQDRATSWAAMEAVHTLLMPKLKKDLVSRRVEFPNGVRSVGELAERIVALNRNRLIAEYRGWTSDDVWKTLCQVIIHQTGVELNQITPEARLVDDLGID